MSTTQALKDLAAKAPAKKAPAKKAAAPKAAAPKAAAPKATVQLHDDCPVCGFHFAKPQAKCNVPAACARRAEARKAEPVKDTITGLPAQ